MKDNGLAVQIDNLTVRYEGRPVVCGFSLRMIRGEKVVLTGPSGAGKSTVLKCLLGLVVPDEGSISILGQSLAGNNVWETRLRLAYVAQEPDLFPGPVRQALERPFDYRANTGLRKNLERLPGLLRRFNLPQPLLDKEVSMLSGGEKQRVAVISAILLERPIILLDEVSSGLDKSNKQALADYFRQASELTVLSVSHDTEWLEVSSRIVNIDHPVRDNGRQT